MLHINREDTPDAAVIVPDNNTILSWSNIHPNRVVATCLTGAEVCAATVGYAAKTIVSATFLPEHDVVALLCCSTTVIGQSSSIDHNFNGVIINDPYDEEKCHRISIESKAPLVRLIALGSDYLAVADETGQVFVVMINLKCTGSNTCSDEEEAGAISSPSVGLTLVSTVQMDTIIDWCCVYTLNDSRGAVRGGTTKEPFLLMVIRGDHVCALQLRGSRLVKCGSITELKGVQKMASFGNRVWLVSMNSVSLLKLVQDINNNMLTFVPMAKAALASPSHSTYVSSAWPFECYAANVDPSSGALHIAFSPADENASTSPNGSISKHKKIISFRVTTSMLRGREAIKLHILTQIMACLHGVWEVGFIGGKWAALGTDSKARCVFLCYFSPMRSPCDIVELASSSVSSLPLQLNDSPSYFVPISQKESVEKAITNVESILAVYRKNDHRNRSQVAHDMETILQSQHHLQAVRREIERRSLAQIEPGQLINQDATGKILDVLRLTHIAYSRLRLEDFFLLSSVSPFTCVEGCTREAFAREEENHRNNQSSLTALIYDEFMIHNSDAIAVVDRLRRPGTTLVTTRLLSELGIYNHDESGGDDQSNKTSSCLSLLQTVKIINATSVVAAVVLALWATDGKRLVDITDAASTLVTGCGMPHSLISWAVLIYVSDAHPAIYYGDGSDIRNSILMPYLLQLDTSFDFGCSALPTIMENLAAAGSLEAVYYLTSTVFSSNVFITYRLALRLLYIASMKGNAPLLSTLLLLSRTTEWRDIAIIACTHAAVSLQSIQILDGSIHTPAEEDIVLETLDKYQTSEMHEKALVSSKVKVEFLVMQHRFKRALNECQCASKRAQGESESLQNLVTTLRSIVNTDTTVLSQVPKVKSAISFISRSNKDMERNKSQRGTMSEDCGAAQQECAVQPGLTSANGYPCSIEDIRMTISNIDDIGEVV